MVCPRRWGRIVRDAAAEFIADQATMVASAVAFRATLAIFPAVAVLVWVGSQLLGGEEVQAALRSAASALPDSTRAIIAQAMSSKLARDPGSGNTGSLVGAAAPYVGIVIALWSTNSGVKVLFVAFNMIFDRTERRSLLRLTVTTLLFTVGALVFSVAVMALVVAVPYLRWLSAIPEAWLAASHYARWPLLYVLTAAALGILYRYAPNREGGKWPLATAGSLGAALVLVGGSAGFSWFVDRFASLSVTYGPLSTAIAFMFWLWLSFGVALAGAELDAAIERERGKREHAPRKRGSAPFPGDRPPG